MVARRHGSAVGINDLADDRESETRPAWTTSASLVGSPEPFKQVIFGSRRKAASVVANLDDCCAPLPEHADLNGRIVGRMDHGVAQKVGEHLPQAVDVAEHAHRRGGAERDGPSRRHCPRVRDGVGGQLTEIDHVARGLGQLVEPSQQHEVVDQLAHAGRLRLDAGHRSLQRGGITRRSEAKQLRVASDRGQGRAQLVRGVGEKLAANLLAASAIGERLLQPYEHEVER